MRSGLSQIAQLNDNSDYGDELAYNEYNSPEVQVSEEDETKPIYYNGTKVSADEIRRADEHLQSVYNDMLSRQQQIAEKNRYNGQGWSNWSPDAKMAFFAAMGGPTRTGGFSESFSNAMGASAPIISRDREIAENSMNKLDELKLRAAQMESNRLNKLRDIESREELSNQKRLDYLARAGIVIDADGKYKLDPSLIKPRGGAGTSSPPTKVTNGLLDPANARMVRAQYGAAKSAIPQLNWLIKQLEDGNIDETAFGVLSLPADAYNATLGQATGAVAKRNTAFRNSLGIATEQMKRALSRDGTGKMSNQEAKEIEPFLPSTGVFESRDKALMKLRNARNKILDSTRMRLEDLQDPVLMDELDRVSTLVAESNDAVPRKLKANNDKKVTEKKKEEVNLFPMKVYKDGHEAVVSDENELKEATQDGWGRK